MLSSYLKCIYWPGLYWWPWNLCMFLQWWRYDFRFKGMVAFSKYTLGLVSNLTNIWIFFNYENWLFIQPFYCNWFVSKCNILLWWSISSDETLLYIYLDTFIMSEKLRFSNYRNKMYNVITEGSMNNFHLLVYFVKLH